jgi:DNA-binding LytR/AlgR family response regulator
MAGMNGAELLQVLRQRDPALPAIMVTGYAEPHFMQKIERLSLLRKPYRIHELAAKVDAALSEP